MKTINEVLEEIKELSNLTSNMSHDQIIFNMGQIYSLSCEYTDPHRIELTDGEIIYIDEDKKAVEEALNNITETKNSFQENTVKTKNSFQEFCEQQIKDSDDKILHLLERNGSHMNLKFELDKRYPNKSYLKTVKGILSDMGINTMSDFLVFMDDPKLYDIFHYNEKYIPDEINKKYHISRLNLNDRLKLAQLYLTANEYEGQTADHILKKFLKIEGQMRETRFVNALIRATGVQTINQLYFYLQNLKNFKDFKKLRGLSNPPIAIENLYNNIHKGEN